MAIKINNDTVIDDSKNINAGIGTFTNLSISSLNITSIKETVYSITDGDSVVLDPNNGSMQVWEIDNIRTPTQANWAEGQRIRLHIKMPTPYFVNYSASDSDSVANPTHIAGDTLIAFAYNRNNTTAISTPSGWTSADNGSNNSNAFRLAVRRATDSSTPTATFTNASHVIVANYRAVTSSTPIVASSKLISGGSTILTFNNLLYSDVLFPYLSLAFVGVRALPPPTEYNTAPIEMTNKGFSSNSAFHESNNIITADFDPSDVSLSSGSQGQATVVTALAGLERDPAPIDWSTLNVDWNTIDGLPPVFTDRGHGRLTAIELWKVGSVIYGARVGDA